VSIPIWDYSNRIEFSFPFQDTPKPSAQVLSDVLEILMSKDIKVSFSKSPNAAEDDEGAEDEGEAKEAAVPQDAMAAAKGKILSQVSNNFIESLPRELTVFVILSCLLDRKKERDRKYRAHHC